MSRELFTVLVAAVAALALFGMWLGWRARTRRDAGVLGAAKALTGDVLAEFTDVHYVSTTPTGEPLVRVAAPGLRYRGPAEVTIRRDGVTIAVAGERPVHLAITQIDGSGAAGRRVGKAVEPNGLGLLRWQSVPGEAGSVPAATRESDVRKLESSFRFPTRAEQRRFADMIDTLVHTQEGS